MQPDSLSPLGEPEKLQLMQLLSEKPLITRDGMAVYTHHPSEFSAKLFKDKPIQKTEFLSQQLLLSDGLDSDRVACYIDEAARFVPELNNATIANLESALQGGTGWEAAKKLSGILAEHYYSKNDSDGIFSLFKSKGANRLSVLSSLASSARLSPANALCATDAAFLCTEDKNAEVRYAALALLMETEPLFGEKETKRLLETLQRLAKDTDKLVFHIAGKRLSAFLPYAGESTSSLLATIVPKDPAIQIPTTALDATVSETATIQTSIPVPEAAEKKPVRVRAHSDPVADKPAPLEKGFPFSRAFSPKDFHSPYTPKISTQGKPQRRPQSHY